MIAYTVEFSFSNGPAYPTTDDKFTSELDKSVKVWEDAMEADGFGMLISGGRSDGIYDIGWEVVPVNVQVDNSGSLVCFGMAEFK